MNKTLLVIVAIAALVVVGGLYFANNSSNTTGVTGGAIVDVPSDSNVRTFVVDSSHLRFYIDGVENPDIKVNEGDTVRIEFSSSEGMHDWVLDEFNARTNKVNPGETAVVEFVADKAGTYEYYCSVGQHRVNGMFGKFIVQ